MQAHQITSEEVDLNAEHPVITPEWLNATRLQLSNRLKGDLQTAIEQEQLRQESKKAWWDCNREPNHRGIQALREFINLEDSVEGNTELLLTWTDAILVVPRKLILWQIFSLENEFRNELLALSERYHPEISEYFRATFLWIRQESAARQTLEATQDEIRRLQEENRRLQQQLELELEEIKALEQARGTLEAQIGDTSEQSSSVPSLGTH